MSDDPPPAPSEAPAESKLAVRTRWAVAISSVAAIALMLAVIVLARQDDAGRERGKRTSTVRPRIGDAQTFGGIQQAERDRNSACGTVDLDEPPVVEFLVDGGKLDFGKLKQGVKFQRLVEFRNGGSGPLCVYNVKTGCGCMKAEFQDKEKERYEPGEKGTVVLHVDTARVQGTVAKDVTILSNDPKNPRRSFRATLEVNAGLMADRSFLDFGSAAPGQPVTRALLLKSPNDEPEWKVTGLESTRRVPGQDPIEYTFKTEPIKDPRFRRVKLSITHPGFRQTGSIQDSIVIKTTHPERRAIRLGARINIVPRILSRSRVISLGYVRSGHARPPTRARIQAGAPGVEFEIKAVEVVPKDGEQTTPAGPGFTATFGSDERGWWVDVKYDGKARKAGLLEAVLLVHLSDTEQPELRVPVRATIRKPR